MTFEQFLEADEMEQIEAIWRGKLVAEKSDSDFRFELYEVDGFYIEAKRNIVYGFIRSITPYKTKDEALLLWND